MEEPVPSPFADGQPRHGTERPLLDTARIVRDGALLSVVASTYLLLLLRFNPRIFLGHYPKEIREIVPPKSEKERRMSILLGLLIALDPSRRIYRFLPSPHRTGNRQRGSTGRVF